MRKLVSMMKTLLVSSLLVMLIIPAALQAQERSVTGVITGDEGALSGVTVRVKGTNRATQTSTDGRFSIRASTGETLQFSFVGYEDQELKVGEGSAVNVKLLVAQNSALQDVVVVSHCREGLYRMWEEDCRVQLPV
jgi:hypothetical protein